jgi:serine/threonine protein kinase
LIDLVVKLLNKKPESRLSIFAALKHDWFKLTNNALTELQVQKLKDLNLLEKVKENAVAQA